MKRAYQNTKKRRLTLGAKESVRRSKWGFSYGEMKKHRLTILSWNERERVKEAFQGAVAYHRHWSRW
jgi:hypothetical protein